MMGELAEFYNEWDKDKKAKKKNNLESSTKILISRGISFTSHNNGLHLVIDNKIDFYPSTGKYKIRGGKAGRGVKKLFKLIESEVTDE